VSLACPGQALLQSQPRRLEPQILSQEHGEDAAQVVYRGGVQVGLRVMGCVPDVGEGHGDEGEREADLPLSGELDTGPCPTTLRS